MPGIALERGRMAFAREELAPDRFSRYNRIDFSL